VKPRVRCVVVGRSGQDDQHNIDEYVEATSRDPNTRRRPTISGMQSQRKALKDKDTVLAEESEEHRALAMAKILLQQSGETLRNIDSALALDESSTASNPTSSVEFRRNRNVTCDAGGLWTAESAPTAPDVSLRRAATREM